MENPVMWREYVQMGKEMDQVYHQAATDLGLSDSTHCLLYAIWEQGDGLTPSQLYSEWSLNKQTGHSALMWLERKGLIRLDINKTDRRQKAVYLTVKGQEYAAQTILPMLEAEQAAFDALTDEEKRLLTDLSRKTLSKFKEEMARIDFAAKKTLL